MQLATAMVWRAWEGHWEGKHPAGLPLQALSQPFLRKICLRVPQRGSRGLGPLGLGGLLNRLQQQKGTLELVEL